MIRPKGLGRQFGWLWRAYAVSTVGTWLGFGAFPVIAIRVLHSGPAEVAILAAAGPAVGAILAVPLGPWIEFRRKRPVMITMDIVRFMALMTIPIAYGFGQLSYVQLLVVSAIVAAAQIAFSAASGAYLKSLIPSEDLMAANGRFESTSWSAAVLGPPLGGAAIGLFGSVATVILDAVSYLLSALGITAIGNKEQKPEKVTDSRMRLSDIFAGWRYILAHRSLRLLFINNIIVGGLIMATEPLLSVLMLGRLGFAPWQYGLAFALPCTGGLIGSRLSRRLVKRYGQHTVMVAFGTLRAIWPLGMAFVRPGTEGIVLVMIVQFGLITCMGIYNPVVATYQLQHTEEKKVARVLSAWRVTSNATRAGLIALWGVLATVSSPRLAIAAAGGLMLLTPFLLPRRETEFSSKLAQATSTPEAAAEVS